MASIEPNGVISIIRLKWEWELIYLNRMANEACRLSSDQSLSGERLAVDALELPAEVPCTPSGSKMSIAHFLNLWRDLKSDGRKQPRSFRQKLINLEISKMMRLLNTLCISCGYILRAIHCEDSSRQEIKVESKEVTVSGTITGNGVTLR